jgi:hypothetical protein
MVVVVFCSVILLLLEVVIEELGQTNSCIDGRGWWVPSLVVAAWLIGAELSAIRAAAAGHHFQALHFLAHGFVEGGVGQEDQPAVQRVPRGPGSRTLRVHHLRKAERLIGSGLHCM